PTCALPISKDLPGGHQRQPCVADEVATSDDVVVGRPQLEQEQGASRHVGNRRHPRAWLPEVHLPAVAAGQELVPAVVCDAAPETHALTPARRARVNAGCSIGAVGCGSNPLPPSPQPLSYKGRGAIPGQAAWLASRKSWAKRCRTPPAS